jgi:hypothetical protein
MAERGIRGENIFDPQAAARDLLTAGATPAVGAGVGAASRLGSRGAPALDDVADAASRSTFYHGTDIDSAVRLLNGEPLRADNAAARTLGERQPGFYLATREADAEYFAARRQGGVIEYDMSARAVSDLEAHGAVRRPIPRGANSPHFEGDELHIPTTAFDRFNSLRDEGEINVRPR